MNEGGREGEREGGREGEREGGREGGREGEGEREDPWTNQPSGGERRVCKMRRKMMAQKCREKV